MIFIIKVTTNKEDRAVDMIADRVTKKNLNVFSIVRAHGMKGYIIMEAADRDSAEESAFNLPYVKGIIGKTVTYEEIKHLIEPKVEAVNIEIGDIIEMIGTTFKGEKAKVIRFDKTKGEVVVSLLGSAVPIPVTVKVDNVKVIRREDKGDESESAQESDKSSDDGDNIYEN